MDPSILKLLSDNKINIVSGNQNVLQARLKRDKVMKQLYELQIKYSRELIILDAEDIKNWDIKSEISSKMLALAAVQKKYCKNHIQIQLVYRANDEKKLSIINKLIDSYNEELSTSINREIELKISQLTDEFNGTDPEIEEKKIKLERLEQEYENEIRAVKKEMQELNKKDNASNLRAQEMKNSIRKIESEIDKLTNAVKKLSFLSTVSSDHV